MRTSLLFLTACTVVMCAAPAAFCGPIHEAAKSGDVASLKALLDKDPGLLVSKDEIGKTPVHWAVGRGQPEALKLLLDVYKADPNIRNNNNGTPLHVAASQAQPECARILIARGADVNARTVNDSTPLHFAAFKGAKAGHIQALKVLIEGGADVNARTDTGATPLNFAMMRKNTEAIALLKAAGAQPGSVQRGMRGGKGNYYLDDAGM